MDLFDSLYNTGIEDATTPNVLLDEAFRKHYPQLHDFIVRTEHNGKQRDHGRVTITAENGSFKIMLADHTGESSFGIECPSIEEGLASMENHCDQNAVRWYRWPSKSRGKGTKKNLQAGNRNTGGQE